MYYKYMNPPMLQLLQHTTLFISIQEMLLDVKGLNIMVKIS